MSSGRALGAHGNFLTATKLTFLGLARRCTLATPRRDYNTISGPRMRNFPTVVRETEAAPKPPALTRFTRTELAIWGRIRPWSIRAITLHITITAGGWKTRICSEAMRRTTCQLVSCRNSTALGLYLVAWVEVVTVIVGVIQRLDTLGRCGQITPPWDNSIRRTSGCYPNNRLRNNTRRRVHRVW